MSRHKGGLFKSLRRIFRERQIYHRSDGVVRFIKLSPQMQMISVIILILAVVWLAYATVNQVFSQQIFLETENKNRNERTELQTKLRKQTQAYTQIVESSQSVKDEFETYLNQLQSRQATLEAVVQNKQTFEEASSTYKDSLSKAGPPNGRKITNGNRIMIDATGREPTPRQSRISRIQIKALQEAKRSNERHQFYHKQDKDIERIRLRTAKASADQIIILAQIEHDILNRINELNAVLDSTRIDTDVLVAKNRIAYNRKHTAMEKNQDFSNQGGGPLSESESETNSVFFQSAQRIATATEELEILQQSIKSVPLGTPLHVQHSLTSAFGFRTDPVTRKRGARHSGQDYRAARKSPIKVTAEGVVLYAGWRSGYGNTVEVDHGNGFVTRYAHLNKVMVKKGQKVKLYDTIGLLGSTGKSTGPHLHYEVHVDGVKLNPLHFLKAGRYVYEG